MNDNKLKEFGGIEEIARDLTDRYIDSVYEVTGDDFYVVSLCATPSNKFVQDNGLLSQWRGYGADGGFAIVFSTKKLEELIDVEIKKFLYGPSLIADVIYSDDKELFEQEFLPHFEVFAEYGKNMLLNFFSGNEVLNGADAMAATHMCMTRFKHEGFKEEKEVRIVFARVSLTPKLVEYYAEKHTPLPIAKPLEFRSGRTNPIPFIKLFGFPDHKLPIERIIVGPSANKELNANAVRKLVEGEAIEVTVSETPFV